MKLSIKGIAQNFAGLQEKFQEGVKQENDNKKEEAQKSFEAARNLNSEIQQKVLEKLDPNYTNNFSLKEIKQTITILSGRHYKEIVTDQQKKKSERNCTINKFTKEDIDIVTRLNSIVEENELTNDDKKELVAYLIRTYFNKGVICFKLGDEETAEEIFKTTKELYDYYTNYYPNLKYRIVGEEKTDKTFGYHEKAESLFDREILKKIIEGKEIKREEFQAKGIFENSSQFFGTLPSAPILSNTGNEEKIEGPEDKNPMPCIAP